MNTIGLFEAILEDVRSNKCACEEGRSCQTCNAVREIKEALQKANPATSLRVELNGAHILADKNSVILADDESATVQEFTWPEIWRTLWNS